MIEFPPFRLDIADQSLWRGEQRVALTPKAFAVLQFLVERAGRLVTQNEILEALWPETFVQPEVLKSQILDVRTALGDKPKEPRFIETVPRRGYRFIAPIGEVRKTAAPAIKVDEARTLAGRAEALRELYRHLDSALSAQRRIVFITGEQGIGKSTVSEAFLEGLTGNPHLSVARGQCLEGFGGVKEPYYPVLEALGHLGRGSDRETLGQVLETHAPTWLIQLPALLKREHREMLQRELLGATRERMIREICEALEYFAEQKTLVLLFEDLHWADPYTIDLIAALAYRRTPARLLLLGTYRPLDVVLAQHPLKQVGHSLKAQRLSFEIALPPLAEPEIAEFLSMRSCNRQLSSELQSMAAWIRKQTEGNPLFVVTVLEHLMELGHISLQDGTWALAAPLEQLQISIPDTLRQTIELQIERLSPREQLVLEAASVSGVVFSANITAQALEMEAEAVEDTCQKLALHKHIVRAGPTHPPGSAGLSQSYEFLHAAIRGVFYHRLAPSRRMKMHRRLGEVLEAACGAKEPENAAELAEHFEQSGDWPRVLKYLWIAAKNAWRRFEYRGALAILERALETASKLDESERMLEETRILQRIAGFYHALHDMERIVPTLQAVVQRASQYGMREAEVRGLLGLASLQGNHNSEACRNLLDRVQGVFEQMQDPLAKARTRGQWATIRLTAIGWDRQLAEQNAADVALIREKGDRMEAATAAIDHAYVQWAASRYRDSLKAAEESLPVLLESGGLFRFLQGRDLLATNLIFLGQWGKALDILEESVDSAHRNEARARLAMPLIFKAWTYLNAMDYSSVLEMCGSVLPWLGPYLVDRRYLTERLMAAAQLGTGDVAAALPRLETLRDDIERCPVTFSWYWRLPLHVDLVEAYLASGDVAKARQAADRCVELAMLTDDRTWQALALEARARVGLQEGAEPAAEQDVQRAIDVIHGHDVPLAAWKVHRTAATLHRSRDAAESVRHRDLSRQVIDLLGASLSSRPQLQRVFLSSPAVVAVLAG